MWELLIPVVGKLLDKILPDTEKAAEAKARLIEMQMNGELQQLAGQLEINKEEAKSTSWFVAGWRPFIGWICGASLGYVALIEPMARFAAAVGWGYSGAFPAIDTTMTMQVLLGMLGLGVMRSTEKIKGAEGKR
jgi:hypothetical protein